VCVHVFDPLFIFAHVRTCIHAHTFVRAFTPTLQQVDVDRVTQALRGVMAFCETDDLTAESSRINAHKIAAALRGLTSKISTGAGGGRVCDAATLRFLSVIFTGVAGVIGHVAFKLSRVAGSSFQAKQRLFTQAAGVY